MQVAKVTIRYELNLSWRARRLIWYLLRSILDHGNLIWEYVQIAHVWRVVKFTNRFVNLLVIQWLIKQFSVNLFVLLTSLQTYSLIQRIFTWIIIFINLFNSNWILNIYYIFKLFLHCFELISTTFQFIIYLLSLQIYVIIFIINE